MTTRILGIDPGLTRCGWGVVDMRADRTATLVAVGVIRTDAGTVLEERLALVSRGFDAILDEHAPQAIALERVFAQQNLSTVMGVAQVSGVVLATSGLRGIPIGMHTPSEVKAAITGYGAADKTQVGAMVARVLRLAEAPKPADAADALALALCHGWRGAVASGSAASASVAGDLTPAQQAWRAAERSTARHGRARSLGA